MASSSNPGWVSAAVFYQIFPDRFARGAGSPPGMEFEAWDAAPTRYGFKGGDLAGVAGKLDYLADLGVNALYLNPIFQSTANHRYHTHDFFRTDPLLGGDGAFRQLLDAGHQRGMKVVLDGVFNHASRGFFQFSHILENGAQSPYVDWFHIRSFPLYAYDPEATPPGYEAWWGIKALPKFNTATPAVRQYLLSVAAHWIEAGIDGWRLDVPSEIDDDSFWQEFRQVVKSRNPDAYIVGEIWQQAGRWLQGDQFDAVLNYQFTRACIEYFIGANGDRDLMDNGYGTPEPTDAAGFAARLDRLRQSYAPSVTASMLNPLDSHDTPRFLSMARGDESALRMALLMQMTYPGAPLIFYGDELGLMGGKDPDMRRAMPWDPSRWNHELLDNVKRLIALRRTHAALREGSYETLLASGMIYAFARADERDVFVVAFNVGPQGVTVSLRAPVTSFALNGLSAVWASAAYSVSSGAIQDIYLAPRTGIVLQGGPG